MASWAKVAATPPKADDASSTDDDSVDTPSTPTTPTQASDSSDDDLPEMREVPTPQHIKQALTKPRVVDVVVIGAGVSGLRAARDLVERGGPCSSSSAGPVRRPRPHGARAGPRRRVGARCGRQPARRFSEESVARNWSRSSARGNLDVATLGERRGGGLARRRARLGRPPPHPPTCRRRAADLYKRSRMKTTPGRRSGPRCASSRPWPTPSCACIVPWRASGWARTRTNCN